ncbi:PQQ-like beta-propeller repeat protein [Paractinoplanes maris]|uniref:PQQ-like beta-propeller repeat protein n=1 Tax=Paractinoplanes maris TaxID=1734446 RepID=UPI0020223D91|nr:PQQ-like beta-propeller repeat protein [Actinoplanes maris]
MLIDLDVAPPAPERLARARRPGRYALLAVAVLVLALMTGSSAPGRLGGVTEVLSLPASGVSTSLLTEQALYLVRADGGVEAHPLCPGCPSWTSRATPGQRLTVAAGDTLVIDGSEAAVATFLDARTGALRWRLRDSPIIDILGTRVLGWSLDNHELHVHDLGTGRKLWSRPAPAYTGDGAYVAILDGRGGASVVSAADGHEVTARRDLGLSRVAGQLLGDQLIVFGADFIAGFRRDGLRREWLTRGIASYQVSRCGDGLLCAVGVDGLTVLDPADGSVRWTGPNWRVVRPGGVVGEESDRWAQVDLATGRVLRELGPAAPIGGLRLSPEPGRTTVIGLADGRVRGTLPLVLPDACGAAGPYLGCETPDVNYVVWRMP